MSWFAVERAVVPVGERGLLDLSELSPQELELCAKTTEGSLLDLRSPRQSENDPIHGRAWGPERRIRAKVLFQLLTGQGPALADSVVAVRLTGAQIVGRLNLGGWTLRCPLDLTQCHVRHRLDLAKAEAASISLRRSYLHSRLSARRLRVQHSVNLTGLRCNGVVNLADAHISGQLDCVGAILSNPHGTALNGEGLVVDTGMFLRRAVCIGQVRLPGARISGQLNCDETTFSNPNDITLDAERLVVDGSMFLDKAKCAGQVWLPGANISGRLNCFEATFASPDDVALGADGLAAAGGMFLDGVQITGEVRLLQARIGSQLRCDGAKFINPGGRALKADGLLVDGSMLLRKAAFTGEVELPGAHVTGQLSLLETTVSNPDGLSLFADRLIVDSELLMRNAQFTGEVRLLSAHITGQFDCSEVIFTNPGGDALAADSSVIEGNLFLLEAQCVGRINLTGSHITGQLNCDDATFSDPDGFAVDLEQATVGQAVFMRPALFEGGLDLLHARVGAWHDKQSSWPTWIRFEGFVYEAIHAPDTSTKDRLRSWFPRSSYAPQPYEQLASVYTREGNDQAARAVSIAKQRARRADYSHWSTRGPAIAWSAVLRWSIGYGYRPVLALIPLTVLSISGSVLFQAASQDPKVLHPAKPGSSEQPSFDAFRYTMDLLLPVVNFKQRDSFIVDGWAAWASFGFNFAGWLLAAIVVAGLAGVFKQD